MKVFYENYKDKFWYWEITEMYRKLTLISFIFLFGSNGVIQIGLTLLVVSVFGVAYTLFRPIKGKFEDRLQTFVLWKGGNFIYPMMHRFILYYQAAERT